MATDFSKWSVSDLYWKMDSEGGVIEIIYWGGPEVFTPLGPEAVEAARQIESNGRFIQGLFDEHEEELYDGEPF